MAADSGVTISVNGSSITATSGLAGQWTLSGLTPGSYTLTFTKSGFGTVEQFTDSVAANDTTKLANVVMSAPPAAKVGFQAFEFIAPKTFVIDCNMPTPATEMRTLVCCLSADSALLDATPYLAQWTDAIAGAGDGYSGSFNFTDTTIDVQSLASGTVVYGTVCIAGEGPNYSLFSSYYDPVSNREIYSSLGPHSRIIPITIP